MKKQKENIYTIGTAGNEPERYRYDKRTLAFSKSHISLEALPDILGMMRQYEPKWLMLQPSTAVLLCRCMERFGIEPLNSVEYIEFTGEILTGHVRQLVKKFFRCRVANQYGVNKFNSIAFACHMGTCISWINVS